MSLVGTRPPTVDEWEQYELHHRSRMSTKPGITGMWQVSGRSDITDFEEVVRLDTEYIYQIWTTYNKKWSKYEILAFSVILLLTVIIMAYCLWKKKLNIIQAGAVVAMVIFLGIVFGSTVFTRTSTVRQYVVLDSDFEKGLSVIGKATVLGQESDF